MAINLPVRAVKSVRKTTTNLIHAFLACCLMAVAANSVADEHVPVDYLGHNTAVSVANGQIGITVPDSINLGDFLIAQIAFTGGNSVEISDVPDDWQLLVREDRNDDLGHAVYYQIVGNPGAIPAPGTAFQWVFDQDVSAIGAITRYSGVDFNDPIQAIASEDGNSAAMKVPSMVVPELGNVINLYAIGAVSDLRKPGPTTLRYNVSNPEPVTVGLRDYRIDNAPTQTSNDVVLGSAGPPWSTHSVAVRARVGSLIDPFNSLISADPVEITADGASTSIITVQARDAAGNNIDTGGATVVIETDAGTLLGSVVDNGDGTYTQQLQSSTTVDTATVTGTIYGFDINGSATVNFVAGDVDGNGSTISAGDSQLPADGVSSTAITVQVRDEFGNPVAEAGLPVTLSTTLGSLGNESGVTDGDGRFETSLTSATTEDTAVVSGTLDGDPIGNTASVEFVASSIDPLTSTITATDSQLTANGTDTTTVTVQLREASGVEVHKAGVEVNVFSELGASLNPASGPTDANGRFTSTLTAPTTAGSDTISGRVLGVDISNTAQVEYVAGSATRLRFAQHPADGNAGEPFATTVEVIDANGNRVESANNSITVQITQPGDATLSGTLTDSAANGLASFSDLSIDLAGDYTLTATTSGLTPAVSNSFHIDASAAGASGADSFIGANPVEIVANGVSTSTITVEAQDEFGNPVAEAGLSVTLSTTAGELAHTSGLTDDNGQFITTLTSATTPGTATVSGTLSGEEIGNTASVEFTEAGEAGVATALAFDIQPANSVKNFPIRGPVTVGFVDDFGDPVTDFDAEITIEILSGPEGAVLDGSTVQMSEEGFVVFFDITLDTAGTYQLRATASNMEVAESVSFEVRDDRLFHDRFQE